MDTIYYYGMWLLCIAGLGLAQVWMSGIASISSGKAWAGLWEGLFDCNLFVFTIGTAGSVIYSLLALLLQSKQISAAATASATVKRAASAPGAVNAGVTSVPAHPYAIGLALVLGVFVLFLATSSWSSFKSRSQSAQTTGQAALAHANEVKLSILCAALAVILAFFVEQLK